MHSPLNPQQLVDENDALKRYRFHFHSRSLSSDSPFLDLPYIPLCSIWPYIQFLCVTLTLNEGHQNHDAAISIWANINSVV